MDTEVYPREWLRGTLEPCLLACVGAAGTTYGYELAHQLRARGLGAVPGGTLYPALTRLEGAGLVDSRWQGGDGGPGRKYYEITEAGRQRLDELATQWRSFSGTVTQILEGALRT